MGRFRFGWAIREYSTELPVMIPGQSYIRVSEGIHDPLCITALCIDSGEGSAPVIFCSVDISSLYHVYIDAVQDAVAEKNPKIPRNSIIMNSTHTHTAMALYKTPDKSPDGVEIYPGLEYLKVFADLASDAICEAWEKRSEGGMAYGYGYAVVAHSRRSVYSEDQGKANPLSMAPNGYAVMYGGTFRPSFSHYEAGADHFLNLMFTFDRKEELTGIVVNVPCPSQTSENWTKQSADFWNEVREMVWKEYGRHVYVLPLCAPAGDLSPRIMHYRAAQERRFRLKYGLSYDPKAFNVYNKAMGERLDIAERILNGIRDVYSWARKDIKTEGVVEQIHENVPITKRRITEEEKRWCEENIEVLLQSVPDRASCTDEEYRKAYSTYINVKNRNEGAIRKFFTQDEEPLKYHKLNVVRVGDIAFATSPFELYQDYMHRIQARSPFIQTFTVQLCGDGLSGYLATERAVKNKGYSASLFCNTIGPDGGQEVVEWTLANLEKLNSQA